MMDIDGSTELNRRPMLMDIVPRPPCPAPIAPGRMAGSPDFPPDHEAGGRSRDPAESSGYAEKGERPGPGALPLALSSHRACLTGGTHGVQTTDR